MDGIFSFLAPLFWGVLLLSLLVFVHEGGHFLAARACGVRVTEFFLGMPCRFNLHHESKRIGTKFGVTPLLLGGYAAICGMDPDESPHAASVLGYIYSRGRASIDEMADALQISSDEALDACIFLMGWGSIAPVYNKEKGEGPTSRSYPSVYESLARDEQGNTIFDGHSFDRSHSTKRGEPWVHPKGDFEFLEDERAHTYLGKGFWKRAFMLVAGIGVNLVCGIILFVFAYSVVGITAPVDTSYLGGVTPGSPMERAGVVAGDMITKVDGVPVSTWTGLVQELDKVDGAEPVQIEFWHPSDPTGSSVLGLSGDELQNHLERNGSFSTASIQRGDDGAFGITVYQHQLRISPLESTKLAFGFLYDTAAGVGRLLMPQHTMEILDNSTSVVGISVMSAEAAEQGAASFLSLAALISFSLGFMNLLPIPPLDGGKLVIEVIQAITKRQVPLKVQLVISYIGIGLFGLLFVYMLRADILRFFF